MFNLKVVVLFIVAVVILVFVIASNIVVIAVTSATIMSITTTASTSTTPKWTRCSTTSTHGFTRYGNPNRIDYTCPRNTDASSTKRRLTFRG